MNKLGTSLLLAAGLFCLDVSPAAAHPHADSVHYYNDGYRVDARRNHSMPGWLKRDRHFREWYRHTPLSRYRNVGWRELYDIYRWELRYFGHGYRDRRDKHGRYDRHGRRYRYDD